MTPSDQIFENMPHKKRQQKKCFYLFHETVHSTHSSPIFLARILCSPLNCAGRGNETARTASNVIYKDLC